MFSLIAKVIKDCLTTADGESYAIGRVLGVLLFGFGLGAPTAIAIYLMVTRNPGMADWVSFIGAMTGYIPMLIGAVSGLIWVTNRTEPGLAPGEQSH